MSSGSFCCNLIPGPTVVQLKPLDLILAEIPKMGPNVAKKIISITVQKWAPTMIPSVA